MMSPAMTALTTIVMMVAMMLPSITPTLWRYHRHLRSTHRPLARRSTVVFAAGYASVWVIVSLGLCRLSTAFSPMGMPTMRPPLSPLTVGVMLVCAGVIQCSRWKARRLLECQDCVDPVPRRLIAAFGDGARLGVNCCLSCAAPMAVLFVTGLMEAPGMLWITAAITAERIAPGGRRIARATGVLAMVAGGFLCFRWLVSTAPPAFGRGSIVLWGTHPEAPESWRHGLPFAGDGRASRSYAAMLIKAAYNATPLRHY